MGKGIQSILEIMNKSVCAYNKLDKPEQRLEAQSLIEEVYEESKIMLAEAMANENYCQIKTTEPVMVGFGSPVFIPTNINELFSNNQAVEFFKSGIFSEDLSYELKYSEDRGYALFATNEGNSVIGMQENDVIGIAGIDLEKSYESSNLNQKI